MTSVANTTVEPQMLQDHSVKFTMRGLPLLSEGTSTEPLVITESLWLQSKVYSGGGENALHAHASDDHAFFVLAGEATFYDHEGGELHVGPLEGVFVPRGAFYRFQSTSPENLVILRMASAEEDYFTLKARHERRAPDGSVLSADDPRNHPGMAPRKESGQFFGA